MIVLGIDPDTKTTGIGLVSMGRAIHGRLLVVDNRRAPMAERKLQMLDRLGAFLSWLRLEQPEGANIDRIIIEGQRYRTGSPVPPQDLINLAHVSGMVAGICRELWPGTPILIPEPSDWKGSVPKRVFTNRILERLDITYDPRGGLCYRAARMVRARVPGTHKITKRDVGHVIDALGLADWGEKMAETARS